ncbi:unnamed protein product [Orchesella dallaii]|uniref:Uncharacterized protein n=1 Tax=Orchesella dallaii TaxID=48710 RepID=A0ABP1QJX7_9HEXA
MRNTKKYNPSRIESFMELTAMLYAEIENVSQVVSQEKFQKMVEKYQTELKEQLKWNPYGTLEPTNHERETEKCKDERIKPKSGKQVKSPRLSGTQSTDSFTISQDALYQYRSPPPTLSYGHRLDRDFAYAPPSYRFPSPPMQGTIRGQPQYLFHRPAIRAAPGRHLQHQGHPRQRIQPPPPTQAAPGDQLQHRYRSRERERQSQHPYQRQSIQIRTRAQQHHRIHDQPQQIVPPAQTAQNSTYLPNKVNSFEQLRNNIPRMTNNLCIWNHKFQLWKQAMLILGLPSDEIQEKERQHQVMISALERMNSHFAAQLNFGQQNLQELRQNRRDIPAAAGTNPVGPMAMGGGPPTSVSSIACTQRSSGGVVAVVQKPPPPPIPQASPSTSAGCAGNQNETHFRDNATVDTDSGTQLGTTLTLNDVIVAGGYGEQVTIRKLETEEIPIPDLVDFMEEAIRDRSITRNIQNDLNTLDPPAETRKANNIDPQADSAPNAVVNDGALVRFQWPLGREGTIRDNLYLLPRVYAIRNPFPRRRAQMPCPLPPIQPRPAAGAEVLLINSQPDNKEMQPILEAPAPMEIASHDALVPVPGRPIKMEPEEEPEEDEEDIVPPLPPTRPSPDSNASQVIFVREIEGPVAKLSKIVDGIKRGNHSNINFDELCNSVDMLKGMITVPADNIPVPIPSPL